MVEEVKADGKCRMHVALDPELMAELEAWASAHDLTRSEAVRRAIRAALDSGEAAARGVGSAGTGEALDVAKGTIMLLKGQLDTKDEQISELNERLSEANVRLLEANERLKAEQNSRMMDTMAQVKPSVRERIMHFLTGETEG